MLPQQSHPSDPSLNPPNKQSIKPNYNYKSFQKKKNEHVQSFLYLLWQEIKVEFQIDVDAK